MRKTLFAIGLIVLITICPLFPQAEDEWERAAREIKRLPPSAFPELPLEITRELERRGCTIPQLFDTPKPHNVIKGQFARKGQTDWAALCSSKGQSTILVFWRGPSDCPSELATAEDKTFLQTVDEARRIGFSRAISPADAKYIMDHFKAYGGAVPPPLDHEGIDDAFVEKASVARYCHQGEWLRLTGAD